MKEKAKIVNTSGEVLVSLHECCVYASTEESLTCIENPGEQKEGLLQLFYQTELNVLGEANKLSQASLIVAG